MAEISIVCGLGNPGLRYRSTRHNLGFMALDQLSKRHSFSWRRSVGPAQTALWRVEGRLVTVMKPLTLMNASGIALERFGAVGAGELLVISDDLNLPLGKIRLRAGGGGGGHKGLESIIERLGTEEFARLRLGIGAPPDDIDRVGFVLSDFLPEERESVSVMIEAAADIIDLAVRRGFTEAAQRCNSPTDR